MSAMKGSNRTLASCGPGAASGWYCTARIGSVRWRNPSRVWSFRFQCVGSIEAGSVAAVHGESVILRCDRHGSGPRVPDGVVGPAVPELELEGPAAQGRPEELVAEADAEDRLLRRDELFDRRDGPCEGGRIAGTVRQEDPVRAGREDRLRRGGGREDRHAAARARSRAGRCCASCRSRSRPRGSGPRRPGGRTSPSARP